MSERETGEVRDESEREESYISCQSLKQSLPSLFPVRHSVGWPSHAAHIHLDSFVQDGDQCSIHNGSSWWSEQGSGRLGCLRWVSKYVFLDAQLASWTGSCRSVAQQASNESACGPTVLHFGHQMNGECRHL